MAAIFWILLLPFLGTALGAGCVYILGKPAFLFSRQGLSGLASGVMVAASIWSLILPALEGAGNLGIFACLPVLAGIWSGVLGLQGSDRLISRLCQNDRCRGMLNLAVTLHNLPEGMAVGVAAAAYLAGQIPFAGALTLSLGIALQNLPEGAILSLPSRLGGKTKHRAFFEGVMSGIVEPIGGGIAVVLASLVVPILPFLLSFAAGAMLFVVVQELIPQMQKDAAFPTGAIFFTAGFSLMMLLDVLLG